MSNDEQQEGKITEWPQMPTGQDLADEVMAAGQEAKEALREALEGEGAKRPSAWLGPVRQEIASAQAEVDRLSDELSRELREGELEALMAEVLKWGPQRLAWAEGYLERQHKRALAADLLAWAEAKEVIEDLEQRISERVLAMGESVVVGDVRARYYQPSQAYDYETAAKSKACDPKYNQAWQQATTTKESTSWAKICELLGIEKEQIPSTDKPGRVVISWDK
jgi:hypothetical protein